jgi:polyhydroxybutyrate depolymerase
MTNHVATRPLKALALAVLATACSGTDTPANAGSSPGTGGAAGGTVVPGGGGANGGASGSSSGGSGGASQGCGVSTWPAACSTAGAPCSVDVNGAPRTYYVYLPSGYSAAQQYPLVFQFHPMGGTAEQAINMPSIRSSFTAIYVTPQGLTSNGSTGWPNTNGQDIAFTKAMLSTLEANYCVDKARVFSTGFSYGGMMSFAIGCEMSDVFRAIAPMSGALYSDFNCRGTGPAIAMWGSHGLSDSVVPIADGRSARDRILQQNHCGATTIAVDPSPCVSYQGCDAGYPATWCEFTGDHSIPNFASSGITAFLEQF